MRGAGTKKSLLQIRGKKSNYFLRREGKGRLNLEMLKSGILQTWDFYFYFFPGLFFLELIPAVDVEDQGL